jgi:hypothetical protein
LLYGVDYINFLFFLGYIIIIKNKFLGQGQGRIRVRIRRGYIFVYLFYYNGPFPGLLGWSRGGVPG